MKAVLALSLTLACVAGIGYGQAYSTGFEYANQAAMLSGLTAEGWTWNYDPNLVTNTVHSGSTALRLASRVLLERPVNDFGTMNLWVYDAGLIATASAYGPRWGLAKGEEVIGGTILQAGGLDNAVAYAANNALNGNTRTGKWWSYTWVDAGDMSGFAQIPPVDTRSRGVAGWMNWEISYYPNGTIEINLLDDPNGGGPKAYSANTIGVPSEPSADSLEFIDEATGGASSLYLHGSWDNTPTVPFGDLIVDDLVWTPADAQALIPGDADGDGTVAIPDFVLLKNNFGATGATWGQGDFDGDGTVAIPDFVILKNNFGATAVPEPATMSLLALGGLALIRRRR